MEKILNEIIKTYDKKSVLSTLKEIIKIPSVSGEERKLAQFIRGKLEQLGVEVSIQKITENSENVIASIKGSGCGPTILMAGHLDTVPPLDGWSTDPFEPIEEEDKIYGLGAADMKAGVATILSVVELIVRNKLELKGNLIISLMADEEGYSKGVKKFLDKGLKADVAFMVEPHFYKAVIGATGKMLILSKVKGKACHAANPNEGINAIEEASKFIANLERIETLKHQKIKSQPYVTLNMHGGYEKYSVTVPDYCTFTLNKHTVPGETKEFVIEQLANLKKTLNLKADFIFEIGEPYYPPYTVDENLTYLKTLKDVYKNVTKNELGLEYSNGVSDSNCLVEIGGIPTVNFGPSGGSIHAPNEWVSKNQLFDAIEIYFRLIAKYLL
ncbi:M20 family peptidase [Thermoanaerobacteraceae bacterium SP2]|nr:M20 family peptidase [Thermoanaerobacteraceae bacterium SP2]